MAGCLSRERLYARHLVGKLECGDILAFLSAALESLIAPLPGPVMHLPILPTIFQVVLTCQGTTASGQSLHVNVHQVPTDSCWRQYRVWTAKALPVLHLANRTVGVSGYPVIV